MFIQLNFQITLKAKAICGYYNSKAPSVNVPFLPGNSWFFSILPECQYLCHLLGDMRTNIFHQTQNGFAGRSL